MKILITGAAGRLGYEVVKICLEAGYSVRAFDLPQVNWTRLESIEEVNIFQGDITDLNKVKEACIGINAVIHLAALLPPKTEVNRGLTHRINVQGTKNLIDSINQETRIVFTSSIATYGVTAKEAPPIKENHPQIPYNNYSESKIIAESLIKTSDAKWQLDNIIQN